MVGSFAYTSKIRDSGTYLPVLENRVKARRTAISRSNLTKTRCTSYLALCKDFARARTFELTSPILGMTILKSFCTAYFKRLSSDAYGSFPPNTTIDDSS